MKIRLLSCIFLTFMTTINYAQKNTFTPQDLWKLKRINNVMISPDQSKILFSSTHFDINKDKGTTAFYVYDINTKKEIALSGNNSKLKNVRWTKSGIAGMLRDKTTSKIVLSDLSNSTLHTLLELPNKELRDFKLSDDGKYLIVLQHVKTHKVTGEDFYPQYKKSDVKIYDNLMYRHWDKWDEGYSDQLFLYKVVDGKAIDPVNLQKGTRFNGILEPFGGLENVIFIKDEKVLYVSKKLIGKEAATSTNSDIYAYDIKTKKTENWTINNKGYDTHPYYLPETNQLLWLSMKTDGFESDKNDLKIRDLNTGKEQNLTAKYDITVSDFIGDEKGKKIYFLADHHATIQIYTLDIKKDEYKQLSNGDYNYVSLALANDKLIVLRQTMLEPNEIFAVSTKDGKVEQLSHQNDQFLATFTTPIIEKRWIETTDHKKMLTWVILPPNFDKTKKYPTLLYCQGGPQAAVNQFFSYRWNFRLMASQGYIVVAPNRRGLPGFGRAWNDTISRHWGGQPILDYLSAIDTVRKESYVDNARLGCVGASYGGYSVYFLAGVHNGRFKTFIAHDGLFDMRSWYGTTEELWFANWDIGGPYWDKKAERTYKEYNPINYVKNWNTPILIIQGGIDFRVPIEQGLEAFQAAQLRGIKSKLLYFPKENHWVLDPQDAMVWQSEFYKWLKETLK